MDERMKQQILDSGALDLDNLTHFKVGDENTAANVRRYAMLADMYREKYGDDWHRRYVEEVEGRCDYGVNLVLKFANTAIYNGRLPRVMGNGDLKFKLPSLYERRMRELYGDQYDELRNHEPGDERVVKLLLDEVSKTGRWVDMPDKLRALYGPKGNGDTYD